MRGQNGAAIGTHPGQPGLFVSAIDYTIGPTSYRHYFVFFDCGHSGAASWTRDCVRALNPVASLSRPFALTRLFERADS